MYVKKTILPKWCAKLSLVSILLFSIFANAQAYEFENGTLTNNANIQGCDSCSGSIVGNLAGNSSVSVNVTLPTAGWYKMQLFYCTGDPRTIRLTPGSAATLAIPCEPSGGWSTAASKIINVYLNAGTTAMLFDNTASWAPNLDKFILQPLPAPQLETITFGNNNSIVYDLNNKTYDIWFNGTKAITNATAYAYSDQRYNSIGYATAIHSSEPFTDNIGSGTKHIFTLSGNNNLQMKQLFYVYSNKDYIAVQVALNGSGANSYKMSPLTSYEVTPNLGTGDTRAVFVPYDNDAWVRYNAFPLGSADFTASEVTNIYNNDNRKGMLIGSVEHTHWKTGITVYGGGTASAYVSVIAGWTQQSLTRDTRGHGWVSVGQNTCSSPKIMIAADTDWRNGFEAYAQANALMQPKYVFDWTAAKPMGWNSWGAMQTNINLAKSKAVVDFFKDNCTAFRTDDNILYMDLDSYWDNMSDTELAQFAAYCESKGFKPGIYWAPFVDWGKYNRNVEGSTYQYNQCWTMVNGAPFELDGAYAMDPTHPGTKDRISWFINRLKTAGFKMIKLDFLTHASIEADGFSNGSLHTGMEAYKEGMQYVIDQLNGQMLTYAAISPNMATGPYVHMRRIACDAYSSSSDTDYTLNSTTYGWWQNKMYDYMDADHVVFSTISEAQNRARLLSAIVTGTIITGDDFSVSGPWVARAQNLLQNDNVMDVARKEIRFLPADGNTGYNAAKVFYANENDTTYVAVFNYSGTTASNVINMERIGLGGSTVYTVKELYSGNINTASGSLNAELPAGDAALYKISANNTTLGSGNTARTNAMAYIFPNPVTASFNIKFANPVNGPVSLSLCDLTGKQVWNTIIIVENTLSPEIPITGLAKGFYMLTATTANQPVQNFKFIRK